MKSCWKNMYVGQYKSVSKYLQDFSNCSFLLQEFNGTFPGHVCHIGEGAHWPDREVDLDF